MSGGTFFGLGFGVALVSGAQQDGVGTSASVATVSGVGTTTAAAVAASAGVATDAFVGTAIAAGAASAAGAATATATGTGLKDGVGASAGIAVCTAVGQQEGDGVGAAAGTSIVLGVGFTSLDRITSTEFIQKPVDFWLPESQTGTQGRPGQLSRALMRSVFNE